MRAKWPTPSPICWAEIVVRESWTPCQKPSSSPPSAPPSARRRAERSATPGRTTSRPPPSPAALARVPGLDPAEVEDVILGCAMPEAEQGLNVARIASLRAGVPHTTSAVTVNRFCASGLQSIAYAAERDPGRRRRRGHRRRHRVDEPRADGRPQGRAQSDARRHATPTSICRRASSPRTSPASRRSAARTRTPSRSRATARRSPRSTPAASRTRSCRSTAAVVDDAPAVGRAPSGAAPLDTDEGPRRDTSLEALAQAQAGLPRARAASPPATRRRRATAPPR